MPTIEELKRRSEKIEHYVTLIDSDRQAGIDELTNDVRAKRSTKAIQVAVLALALARELIEVDDVPVRLAGEVMEKFLKEAPWRERDTAADRGTEVHDIAERISQGEIVDVPLELKGHIESFQNFRDDYGMVFIETEFTVFSTTYNYAGTGDFLGYSRKHPEWGLILGDYKTSSSIWPDIALQLAAIRYADFIARCKSCPHPKGDHLIEDLWEDRGVLGDIETCVGVQINSDGYRVVPVNATRGFFDVFRAALIVAEFKTNGEQWALEEAQFVPNDKGA